ncbi:MAG: transposase [Shimia thalassica]|uniref:transposase n=1 Tax=Shimia thalassica TaxID=1715693 RepID=UPI00329966C1
MSRSYTKEFVQNVVSIALTCGLPVERVAKDFNVDVEDIEEWIAAYKDTNATRAQNANIHRENELLRKENASLKERIETLKKQIALFEFTLD